MRILKIAGKEESGNYIPQMSSGQQMKKIWASGTFFYKGVTFSGTQYTIHWVRLPLWQFFDRFLTGPGDWPWSPGMSKEI